MVRGSGTIRRIAKVAVAPANGEGTPGSKRSAYDIVRYARHWRIDRDFTLFGLPHSLPILSANLLILDGTADCHVSNRLPFVARGGVSGIERKVSQRLATIPLRVNRKSCEVIMKHFDAVS